MRRGGVPASAAGGKPPEDGAVVSGAVGAVDEGEVVNEVHCLSLIPYRKHPQDGQGGGVEKEEAVRAVAHDENAAVRARREAPALVWDREAVATS